MNIILLSGGSGKRLWPLSNDIRSKQFIKMFRQSDGSYESMLQRVYRQISEEIEDASITIATAKNQVSTIVNQLGENVNISIEPSRKDTFPAIVLAVSYLVDVMGIERNESVVVCPVDPYVNSDYFEAINRLSSMVEGATGGISIMGIEPTYPSAKYGYIIPTNNEEISIVTSFKEKPSEEVAKLYIEQGALWNAGIFAFKIQYILDIAHKLMDFVDYQDLYAKYNSLEAISFDYAVVEHEKNMKVLRFSGEWRDLGTWNTLTEAMEENIIGKGVMNDKCSNVNILNEMDVPILAMGLHDVVISASPEGILVSDKEQSSYIKPYVDSFEQQIMFAEKSWGSYRVMDVEDGAMTIKVILNPGHKMNYHSHMKRNEVWVVLSGKGRTIVDGFEQAISAGDVITIEAECKHTVIADTELKLMEVQLGDYISALDKQKFDL